MIQITLPVAVSLVVAFLGCVFGFGRLLLSQFEKRMDERARAAEVLRATEKQQTAEALAAINQRISGEAGRITALTESLTHFMNTLPLEYVRREDWIRFSATIDSKLDRLADLFIKAIGGNNERG